MTTKERTFLFNICVILYNILLGLIVEGVFFFLFLLFIAKTNNQNMGESIYIQIALPVMMLFHLENKLDKKVIEHYKKDDQAQ